MKNFRCSAPEHALFIQTNGGVRFCCAGKESNDWNINDQSLGQIASDKKFIELKQKITTEGDLNHCQACVNLEHAPETSMRYTFNKDFPLDVNPGKLELIDVRWSNLCNLSCRYCSPVFSSVWASMLNQQSNYQDRADIEQVLEYLTPHKETIRSVFLLGGEPLYQKNNQPLIDFLKDDIHIDIFTNLAVKLDKNAIYNSLIKKKNINWNISLENTGGKFEYIRHGARWEITLNNLQKIFTDFGHETVTLYGVYCLYSAFDLEEFYKFAVDQDVPINWQLLQYPMQLSAFNQPKDLRDLAIDQINTVTRLYQNHPRVHNSILTLQNFKNQLELPPKTICSKLEINNFINGSEKLMPGSFSNLWPEIYQLIQNSP